jgi:23S rRNA pseudouridine1911/1915/1917 synthase
VDTVKTYIREKYAKPGRVFLGVVHRIDRPTSGVVIFARTSKSLSRMTAQMRERKVQRVYWAVTHKTLPQQEGMLRHSLLRDRSQNKTLVVPRGTDRSQDAELSYRLVRSRTVMVGGSGSNCHLWQITLLTGRHHQIRAQLAAVGCPIVGDLKYGDRRPNPGGAIHLHARSVSFIHPVRREALLVEARPPQDEIWVALSPPDRAPA